MLVAACRQTNCCKTRICAGQSCKQATVSPVTSRPRACNTKLIFLCLVFFCSSIRPRRAGVSTRKRGKRNVAILPDARNWTVNPSSCPWRNVPGTRGSQELFYGDHASPNMVSFAVKMSERGGCRTAGNDDELFQNRRKKLLTDPFCAGCV